MFSLFARVDKLKFEKNTMVIKLSKNVVQSKRVDVDLGKLNLRLRARMDKLKLLCNS